MYMKFSLIKQDQIRLSKNVYQAQTCSPAPTMASRSELYNISTITKAPAANNTKQTKGKQLQYIVSESLKLIYDRSYDPMPIAHL